MAVEIPLFPLGVVLFPHMPLPLRIFEERYRTMLRDVRRSGVGFGVVAIREGVEVGAAATPHLVGTLAHIREVEERDDGTFELLVVGATRYRIVGVSTERPYLVGSVEYLEDLPGDPESNGRLVAAVTTAFTSYAQQLRALAGKDPEPVELPDDPELLSYLVAGTLQVEIVHKQRLLETDSADQRLRFCLQLLRRELTLLNLGMARGATPVSLPAN